MAALFLDRGAGFRSDDTHSACALLQVAFIHGRASYPEGHGKIEKFNQTWKHQLLRNFDGHPEIDPALPNGIVDFHDISRAVDAFQGKLYPFEAESP